MRDQATRRDQREIVVPRDGHSNRSSSNPAKRRAAPGPAARTGTAALWANTVALACWSGRMVVTRPGEALGSLAALVAVGYVSVNALSLQQHAHPAPILPKTQAHVANAEPAPVAKPAVAALALEAPAPVANEAVEPKRAEKASGHDGIADILRTGDITASVAPKAVDKVALAQRALAKLGYSGLKVDGLMGPATKAAIEKFERDSKLPITGEPSGRTLRALASKAGAAKG